MITYTEEHLNAYHILKKNEVHFDRFSDIKTYKYNRVYYDNYFNYINASYIADIFQKKKYNSKSFIASQAPVPASFKDFWRIILVEKIEIIVIMLEKDFVKMKLADLYWPSKIEKEEKYGESIVVKFISEKEDNGLIVREFMVKDTKENISQYIKQYHIYDWQDKTIPKSNNSLKALNYALEQVELYKENSKIPVLLHCRAGVGRTGTFMALYYLRYIINNFSDPLMSIFLIVRALREQRMTSVQSYGQYEFLYGYVSNMIRALNNNANSIITGNSIDL